MEPTKLTVQVKQHQVTHGLAPTGNAGCRITSSSAWDTAGLVAHNNYASWEGFNVEV